MAELPPDLRRRVAAVVDDACALIARMTQTTVQRWDKSDRSPVTEIDLAVDALLKAALPPLLPGSAWLSEESVDDPARLGARHVWVVDPIDGTRSLIAGRPEFCVSVALVEAGVGPVLGLVANPSTGDRFHAVKGGGAWRGDTLIRVRTEGARPLLLVSRSERRRGMWQDTPADVRIEVASSLAWKMALVAAGEADATLTAWRRSEWDAAAGALLVEEAGGRCADLTLAPLTWNRPQPVFEGIVCASKAAWTTTSGLAGWAGGRREAALARWRPEA